jgi:outer membrane biosynthesis protein TonB
MNVARTLAVALLLAGLLRGFAMQDQSASPSPTPSASPAPSPSPTPNEAAKPKRVRLSSEVADGLRLHYVLPEYPREARKKHIAGDVVLHAIIDRQGKITNILVVSGDPILVKSAIKAVNQ